MLQIKRQFQDSKQSFNYLYFL